MMNTLLIIAQASGVNFTKGWIVTIAGFLIVIIALFILSTIFRGVAAYFKKKDAQKDVKKEVKTPVIENNNKPVLTDGEISPEVLTAIGMALYLSTNLHDEESNVLTIEHHNTAWNAKSYGVRHWNK